MFTFDEIKGRMVGNKCNNFFFNLRVFSDVDFISSLIELNSTIGFCTVLEEI